MFDRNVTDAYTFAKQLWAVVLERRKVTYFLNLEMARFLLPILIFFSSAFSLSAALVQVNGKWSDSKYAPTMTVSQHYDAGYQFLFENQWENALLQFTIIATHFPDSPYFPDTLFFSGISNYFLGDFDVADQFFSRYLNLGGVLKNFEKVFEFKYFIANYYSEGRKKHLFNQKYLPQIVPAKKDAIALYDEIITALPSKEIAVKALFGKGKLLRNRKEFRESIEAFQTITRRFPKHSLAAEAFVMISDIYLDQARLETQNPDLLSLAQVNLSKFQKAFPGDDRIKKGEDNLVGMQEIFAYSLYDTGKFYERKKKSQASKIYYLEAIKRYPQTTAASKSMSRLESLGIPLPSQEGTLATIDEK